MSGAESNSDEDYITIFEETTTDSSVHDNDDKFDRGDDTSDVSEYASNHDDSDDEESDSFDTCGSSSEFSSSYDDDDEEFTNGSLSSSSEMENETSSSSSSSYVTESSMGTSCNDSSATNSFVVTPSQISIVNSTLHSSFVDSTNHTSFVDLTNHSFVDTSINQSIADQVMRNGAVMSSFDLDSSWEVASSDDVPALGSEHIPEHSFVSYISADSRSHRTGRFRERSYTLEECTICCELMLAGPRLTSLPCAHRFHHACIQPWLDSHKTCPNCRKAA